MEKGKSKKDSDKNDSRASKKKMSFLSLKELEIPRGQSISTVVFTDSAENRIAKTEMTPQFLHCIPVTK